MILAIALSVAIQTQKSSEIIGAMFARYHNANTLVGTIHKTMSASYAGKSAEQITDTTVQFERPSKLYVLQELKPRPGNLGQTWLVTSDGVHFSYNVPDLIVQAGSSRLVEAVNEKDRGEILDIPHIYAVASHSLGDRSEPLGIALGWVEEMHRATLSWATINPPVRDTLRGVKGYRISGKHQAISEPRPSGNYEMFISEDGDLMQYQFDALAAPTSNSTSVAKVKIIWDIDLHVGAAPDPKLFKVVVKDS